MISIYSLCGSFIFITSILASAIQRRQSRFRSSSPLDLIESPNFPESSEPPDSPVSSHNIAIENSHVIYSSNWAGAVLTSPPSGKTFTSVSAHFTVPSPHEDGAASAWVGIDGDTYTAAILQTGIDFFVEDGNLNYTAWCEWFPEYASDFSELDISPGDVISLSVDTSSPDSGTAIIENVSTGQKLWRDLSAPSSSSHLGGKNAEWIVEDFQRDGSQVPFTNFGAIYFTDAFATTSSGKRVNASSAQLIDIKQDNKVITSSSASGSNITILHK